MKKLLTVLLAATLFVAASYAASAKSYQVTGPVLAVADSSLTIQKGDEKWELSADKTILSSVKVGDKVTVYYQMVAKSVEAKGAVAAAAEKPAEKPAKAAKKAAK